MAEATRVRNWDEAYIRAAATVDAGQVFQLPSGEAAYLDARTPVSSGEYLKPSTSGKCTVEKTTGIVILPGQDVWWDHSANKAHIRPSNDRDFRIGVAVEDATSAALTVLVDFNKRRNDTLDLLRRPAISDTVGTAAAGGFGPAQMAGGCARLRLTSTNEAQKVALFGIDGIDPASNAIVYGSFRVAENGSTGAADFSIGLVNADDSDNADDIAESLFLHIDSNTLDIYAESDDGTTEVAATDTTVNFTEGSAVANRTTFVMDLRDLEDIQLYIDGVNVLPATAFKLDAATGPLRAVAHLEKTVSAETFDVYVDDMYVWTAEQG